jgi:phospholipase C
VYGPNGYYWRFTGSGAARPEVRLATTGAGKREAAFTVLPGEGVKSDMISIQPLSYNMQLAGWRARLNPGTHRQGRTHEWDLRATHGWYDFDVTRDGDPTWRVRLAGRMDDGQPSMSDPAIGGAAEMRWS